MRGGESSDWPESRIGGAGKKKTVAIPEGMTEDDVKAAEAFKKPTDDKAIKVKKYYIDKLKLADADVFNYSTAGTGERGYVSHCAANESRQPIVLDKDEFQEMKQIYEDDEDLEFIVYPDDSQPSKFPGRQPSKDENVSGKIDAKDFPGEENKEIITLVKYGSKAKRVNYYFCPRLFCVRDRLMVRYKDFKSSTDRKGAPKPAMSCPFCKGVLVDPDSFDKDSDRDPNMTVLQRKTRPGSDTERQIYIGFLEKKKNPSGMSLPCCFADGSKRFTSDNDAEFEKLGLSPISKGAPAPAQAQAPKPVPVKVKVAQQPAKPALAQPLADQIMGEPVAPLEETQEIPVTVERPKTVIKLGKKVQLQLPQTQTEEAVLEEVQEETRQKLDITYEANFYRVMQGVSVKTIVDASRIPLEIVIPKAGAPTDPKSGPQIGLLPQALDVFFEQDSTSDKFAARDITRKLKPTAKGFLRLGVDNTDLNRSFLSALVPFFQKQGNARTVVEEYLDTQITPKRFVQINSGNLVHEFFNKCEPKKQNDMRQWASDQLGIDQLTSNNIPAIERMMNAYECFKSFMDDPNQKKDPRILYQVLAEPGFSSKRGLILITLEVSVEEFNIKKGDKSEFKREIKLEKIKYPPYPLTEQQKQSDVGFIIHYLKVSRDRHLPEKRIFKNYGWEPLIYVEGNLPDGRHTATIKFQKSEDFKWPPIVLKRVNEYFEECSNKRGPFTSQFGFDPRALIGASDIISEITRTKPIAIIRDSYNHMVGVAYKANEAREIISVPVSDDGSMHFNKNVFFDWDDFTPAAADIIVSFYKAYILASDAFRPFSNAYKPKRLRTQDGKVVGLELQNKFVVPAKEPLKPITGLDKPWPISEFEWQVNKDIAYDSKMRLKAFEHAGEEDTKKYVQLESSSIQDELEDVYQHLRLSFSTWLSRAGPNGGASFRGKLEDILKRYDLPVFEKRKRLDIMLETKITRWLEPSDEEDETELGFLRVDCLTQGETGCSGRCTWKADNNTCKIHTPATIRPNDISLHVPRLLYLRLIDELIRFASRRQEIFDKKVPRLTIRQDAQRLGDQYIIPEGSPDWNSWWELLRSEWFSGEGESGKSFDEQFEPIPEFKEDI